jgi:hypothetical protein
MKRHVVIAGEGDPCPRCGQPTEIREHACISNSELRRPFYYRRWFMCRNPDCRTTTIVPAQYRVFNAPEPPWCQRKTAARKFEDRTITLFVVSRDNGSAVFSSASPSYAPHAHL